MRKTVNLNPMVKSRIEELKVYLGLKTESEVIAYLASVYDYAYENLSLKQHNECLQKSKEMNESEMS